jgi:hypothetical protein
MTRQGSLGLLSDPVAKALLESVKPARLACTWMDGSPSLVPIWFTASSSAGTAMAGRGRGTGEASARSRRAGLSSLAASRRAGEEQPLPGVGEVVAELPG